MFMDNFEHSLSSKHSSRTVVLVSNVRLVVLIEEVTLRLISILVLIRTATFANERLVERIKVAAGDPHTDDRVKKKIASVLASWHRQFKDDPRMQLVAGMYKSCGLGAARAAVSLSSTYYLSFKILMGWSNGTQQQQRSAATEAYEREQARYEREASERAERKASEQRARQAEKDRLAQEKIDKQKRKQQGNRVRRPPFNFEQEKPKILASVGQGTQSAQA